MVCLAGLLAVAAAACAGGSGKTRGPSEMGEAGGAPTATTAHVQRKFVLDDAYEVLVPFGLAVGERFEIDRDSVVAVRVADLQKGELQFSSAAEKQRHEFAVRHGLLGWYAADFVTADGEERWGITTQVFKRERGARAVFERFGNTERVTVEDAQRVASQEVPVTEGRVGRLFVDLYVYPDGTQTFALRGSLVDRNALHSVVGLVDVPAGQAFDGIAELRRVLASVDGALPRR